MCGFVGMFKNSPLDKEDEALVLKMSDSIDFRGPDEGRVRFFDTAGVGFRRLSIIDLELGSQPFELGDEYLGIFNGEIYNYKSIRDTLIKKGHKIVAVSTFCGYNDFVTFNRNFKKHFGITPQEFCAAPLPGSQHLADPVEIGSK